VTFTNQLLQGKFSEGMESTARFLVNSTLGVFGIFDVATRAGIPEYDEDFGQTMAKWGWEDSRYFVLPLFGPSTLRDGIGRSYYGYLHPLNWYAREEHVYWPIALDLLQTRANLLEQDQAVFDAYDPYVFVRDAWLQNREYLIFDGEPPTPDYDTYLDDIED
jgi:phospholipid-binding lipoprotein MlaA